MSANHYGWAIAVTAYRDTGDNLQIRTRAYSVGTYHQEDAERHAIEESDKLWPQSE